MSASTALNLVCLCHFQSWSSYFWKTLCNLILHVCSPAVIWGIAGKGTPHRLLAPPHLHIFEFCPVPSATSNSGYFFPSSVGILGSAQILTLWTMVGKLSPGREKNAITEIAQSFLLFRIILFQCLLFDVGKLFASCILPRTMVIYNQRTGPLSVTLS